MFLFSTYFQRSKIRRKSDHIRHLVDLVPSDPSIFFLKRWQELWNLSKHTILTFNDNYRERKLYSWFEAWFRENLCNSRRFHSPSMSWMQSHSFSEHLSQIKIFCRWCLCDFVCLWKKKRCQDYFEKSLTQIIRTQIILFTSDHQQVLQYFRFEWSSD